MFNDYSLITFVRFDWSIDSYFLMWKLVVVILLQSFDQIYLYSSFNFLNSSINSLIQRILMKNKQCILNLFYILVLCEKGDVVVFCSAGHLRHF